MGCPWENVYRNELAASAVGSLPQAEAQALSGHVALCRSCTQELASHHEALAGLTPDRLAPSRGLWERIVVEIAQSGVEQIGVTR